LTSGIYLNGCARHCRPIDAGDKCFCLRSYRAHSDRIGLGGNTCVADIDIIIACGEIDAGLKTRCYIVVAGCVVKKRIKTADRRVVTACCVALEGINTDSRVE
jgi:hypothetical protein